MPKKQSANAQRFSSANSFTEHLKLALEFHNQPQILFQYSPLAKPDFLYQHEDDRDRDEYDQNVDRGLEAGRQLHLTACAYGMGLFQRIKQSLWKL